MRHLSFPTSCTIRHIFPGLLVCRSRQVPLYNKYLILIRRTETVNFLVSKWCSGIGITRYILSLQTLELKFKLHEQNL
jgi:hypothetical protein